MYQHPVDINTALKLNLEQDAWLLHRFASHEVIRLHLAPGQSIEKHRNDWRILFYVLEGQGSLEVEQETFGMTSGQSIAVEAGLERSWKNQGPITLQLLVIKTRPDQ